MFVYLYARLGQWTFIIISFCAFDGTRQAPFSMSKIIDKSPHPPPRVDPRRLRILLCVAFCMLSSLGCQSTDKPASASFASVVISGNTPGQIRDAAVAVFSAKGYKVTQTDPAGLVFEKEANRMNNFAYGSWLGDAPVWARVKAAIVPMGEMAFRLQCHAYMVRDRGSSTEEEAALSSLRKGPYQKLLEEIAARFKFK